MYFVTCPWSFGLLQAELVVLLLLLLLDSSGKVGLHAISLSLCGSCYYLALSSSKKNPRTVLMIVHFTSHSILTAIFHEDLG